MGATGATRPFLKNTAFSNPFATFIPGGTPRMQVPALGEAATQGWWRNDQCPIDARTGVDRSLG